MFKKCFLVCFVSFVLVSLPALGIITSLTIGGGDTSCTYTSRTLSVTGGSATCGSGIYYIYWEGYNIFNSTWQVVWEGYFPYNYIVGQPGSGRYRLRAYEWCTDHWEGPTYSNEQAVYLKIQRAESVTATPQTINRGQSSTISTPLRYGERVHLWDGYPGAPGTTYLGWRDYSYSNPQPANFTVTPNQTTTYFLACSNIESGCFSADGPTAITVLVVTGTDIGRTKTYFVDALGNPAFLIGYYDWATVAPGYCLDSPAQYANMMNQGAPYRINYIRISLGINRMTGSTNPPSCDGRATPIPFAIVNNKADLNNWDATFWSGLQYHCALAAQKAMGIHVAFFDGVDIRGGSESYRWAGSFWNIDNQAANYYGDLDSDNDGNADENGEFYRLNDFNNNTGVGYYQRRLIDKALSETAAYPSVFFEIGNELSGSPSDWNAAVINYVKARTARPISQSGGGSASNRDGVASHSGNDPAAVKSIVAGMVNQGCPAWVDPDGSSLVDGSADNLRRAAWYCLAGGAACWGGFTLDMWNGTFNTTKATYYNNLEYFIQLTGVKFYNMVPSHSLVGNNGENSCIAAPGVAYLAYILNDSSATLNLSAVSGNAYYKLYDPRTAGLSAQQTVAGGAVRTFNKPAGADDWVIYVYTP